MIRRVMKGMRRLENFVKWLQEEGRSEGTIKTYLQVEEFLNWWTQEKAADTFDPEEVTVMDLQEYKQFLIHHARNKRGGRLAAATVNKRLQMIRTYFKSLADTGDITYNPALKIKPQKIQNRRATVRWLEEKEKIRILRKINNPEGSKNKWHYIRNRAMVYTLLMGGLRVSELADLIIPDIDLAKRRLIVHDGKGGKERDVPINDDLFQALSEWLEIRKQSPGEIVFPSQKKGKFTLQGIEHIIGKIGEQLGLEDFTPHVLRHTFCHDLHIKGYQLQVIADLAGHEDLNTTRIYTTPGVKETKKAVNSLSMGDSF